MTATDTQVRIIMRERQNGRTQEQAAAKANVRSLRTVRKYERLSKLPSELEKPRDYRTRGDPFAVHWPEAEAMLADAPELEAKTLFEWLCEQHSGKYQEGQFGGRVGHSRDLGCLQRQFRSLGGCLAP